MNTRRSLWLQIGLTALVLVAGCEDVRVPPPPPPPSPPPTTPPITRPGSLPDLTITDHTKVFELHIRKNMRGRRHSEITAGRFSPG